MKLSQATKYGIAVFGLVLVLCIGLTIYATSASKKIGPVVKPNVCEFCGSQLNKNGDCSKCISEMGPDKYHAKRESKNWYNSPLIASIVIGLLCVLATVHISVLLLRYAQRKKRDDFYHVCCTKCGRRLRYRHSQINHIGRCPLCQKPIRFPEPLQEPRPSVFGKKGGISWRKLWDMVWN